jgi:hypothetical protein
MRLYGRTYTQLSLLVGVLAACSDRGIRQPGPLVALAGPTAITPIGCRVVQRFYATPFWRAPYRECRDTTGGRQRFLELDADSILTAFAETWQVAPSDRTRAFNAEEMRVTALFGPGFRCAPNRIVWHSRDSVRVSLLMRATTDVGGAGAEDSVPSTVSRYARLGPLLDALWCRGPHAPVP